MLQKTSERAALADSVRGVRQAVAEQVTEAFLERHPDWLDRYGERARQLGIADACFHLDFLAGAIESGAAEPFATYARWAAGMLESRGIARQFLSENLEQIGEAVTFLVPGSNKVVGECIAQSRAACMEQPSAAESAAPGDELGNVERAFVEAILLGERRGAVNILLQAVRDGHTIPELYVRVIQESLYDVGRRWERNRITVADEHRATAIVQYAIAQLYPLIPPASESRGSVVIAGVEGEYHQVGSNLVSDALEADGWDVVFLGANTPTSSILHAVETHQPAVLGVSLTMLFNVPVLVRLVEKVRQVDSGVRIVVGGSVVRAAPGLCRELGMDGSARDVQAAIHLFRTFSSGIA